MTLERKDFRSFFAAVHDGHEPYAWQERLLDYLLEHGAWPSRIVAPTGAGKTAAIDVHVFAVALTVGLDRPRLPRRLAMVVGRRVLVDDQYEHAEKLSAWLADPDLREEALAKVAAALWGLWPASQATTATEEESFEFTNEDRSPLVVARLRGGAPPSREWRDHPTACAVICATPDMWGSRLLFRGYGSARRARGREAGLLALDAAAVVDEAHLSRQLLTTARQVSRLARVADEPITVPTLQVVETTATPAGDDTADARVTMTQHGADTVGVSEADLMTDQDLAQRMCRPKPVTLLRAKEWPATTKPRRRRVAALLADQVAALHTTTSTEPATSAAHTIGCFVNSVPMAVEVATALRARKRADGTPLRVVTICGQTRPADLARLRAEHPGVLDTTGSPDVDVLVTTQSLEVGVDLDLAAVVTELAPASALVQRAGRVNRLGRRTTGPVHVLGPAGVLSERDRSGPYQSDELTAAWEWLTRRASDPDGLAPWAVRNDPPPQAARRRLLYQRPQLADAWHWARTSDTLAAEPELDLWLDESFEQDDTVGLVVRDAMPVDATDAEVLIRLLRPQDHEVFAVSPGVARAVLADAVRRDTPGDEMERPLAVRVCGEDISVVDADAMLRPGDIVVIDSRTAAFTPSTSGTAGGFSPPVPVPAGDDAADAVSRATAADVLHAIPPTVGRLLLRLEPGAWPAATWVGDLLKEYAEQAEDVTDRERRRILATLLEEVPVGSDGPSCELRSAAVRLLRGRVKDSDLVLHHDPDGTPLRLILVDRRRAWADERLRQTWLPQRDAVPLDSHQDAVGDRAAWVAEQVGLPEPLIGVLRLAGQHHDDGKSDPRFQRRLGAEPGSALLAKSGGGVPLAEHSRQVERSGLPERWRHEQRSVVTSWPSVWSTLPPPYAQLVARLVGTSHGHGRASFPHTAAELLAPEDPDDDRRLARELFDLGGWDELIEVTHHRWGVWGCAYLEALLRAADGQVSKEGR